MKNKIDIPFMIEPIWIENDYCENTGEKFLPYPGFKARGGFGARFRDERSFLGDLTLFFVIGKLGEPVEETIQALIAESNKSMRGT